jgi:hypothetical protein
VRVMVDRVNGRVTSMETVSPIPGATQSAH